MYMGEHEPNRTEVHYRTVRVPGVPDAIPPLGIRRQNGQNATNDGARASLLGAIGRYERGSWHRY